ncbi:hypothetical protein ACLKA7_001777 [Drosophila subpalustris]
MEHANRTLDIAADEESLEEWQARWNNSSKGSCYITPSLSLTEYGAIIDDIAQDARGKASVIIAGDFNAWATELEE